jgi:hypothetical protein
MSGEDAMSAHGYAMGYDHPGAGPKPIPHWPVFEGILWILWTGPR